MLRHYELNIYHWILVKLVKYYYGKYSFMINARTLMTYDIITSAHTADLNHSLKSSQVTYPVFHATFLKIIFNVDSGGLPPPPHKS